MGRAEPMTTPTTPPNPPRQRPGPKHIEINWEQFDTLCRMHAQLREIAAFFRCSEATIERAVKREHKKLFSEYYAERSTGGRLSLRRKLWEQALQKDNVTALIFLSKQTVEHGGLGFGDRVTQEHEVGNGTYEQLMGLCRELEQQKRGES